MWSIQNIFNLFNKKKTFDRLSEGDNVYCLCNLNMYKFTVIGVIFSNNRGVVLRLSDDNQLWNQIFLRGKTLHHSDRKTYFTTLEELLSVRAKLCYSSNLRLKYLVRL